MYRFRYKMSKRYIFCTKIRVIQIYSGILSKYPFIHDQELTVQILFIQFIHPSLVSYTLETYVVSKT